MGASGNPASYQADLERAFERGKASRDKVEYEAVQLGADGETMAKVQAALSSCGLTLEQINAVTAEFELRGLLIREVLG